jgi:hypothetical protein
VDDHDPIAHLEERVRALDRIYDERTRAAAQAIGVAERVAESALHKAQLQTSDWLKSHNNLIDQLREERSTFVTKTEFRWLIATMIAIMGIVVAIVRR